MTSHGSSGVRSHVPRDNIAVPANFMPEHPFDNGEMRIRDEMLGPFPRTEEFVRGEIAGYYAMISEVDAQIGRVLDALEANGQADNTIVIFAGDNGLAVGQHGLLGKQSMYEHSIRVPLVMAGPGIPSGETRDAWCTFLIFFRRCASWRACLYQIPWKERVCSPPFRHAPKYGTPFSRPIGTSSAA